MHLCRSPRSTLVRRAPLRRGCCEKHHIRLSSPKVPASARGSRAVSRTCGPEGPTLGQELPPLIRTWVGMPGRSWVAHSVLYTHPHCPTWGPVSHVLEMKSGQGMLALAARGCRVQTLIRVRTRACLARVYSPRSITPSWFRSSTSNSFWFNSLPLRLRDPLSCRSWSLVSSSDESPLCRIFSSSPCRACLSTPVPLPPSLLRSASRTKPECMITRFQRDEWCATCSRTPIGLVERDLVLSQWTHA